MTMDGSREMPRLSILITGGTGFIGSHLARLLAGEGRGDERAIHIVERSGVSDWRIADLSQSVKIHRLDIQDPEALTRAVQAIQPSHVVHLASAIDHRRDFSLLRGHVGANFLGTLNLLEALRTVPVQRIINIGTCEEYGDGNAPFTEEQRESPVSPYSFSKTCSTHLSGLCARIFDMPVMTVRPFLTYGEAQSPALLIPQVIIGCLRNREMQFTEGAQTREVNYVGDIVRGLRDVMFSESFSPGSVTNLGNSTPIKIRHLVEKIFALSQARMSPRFGELPYRRGEAFEFFSDNARAVRDFGYAPRVALDDGLKRTIEWYRQNLDRLDTLFAADRAS